MSRAFALWITHAGMLDARGPAYYVSGPALGRAPEPSQALTVVAPFSNPLRTRFRGVFSIPRGGDSLSSTILIEPVDGCSPESLEGAVLVEEGVRYLPFAARLSKPVAIGPSSARFLMGSDRGYGLVRAGQGFLNGILVGGGLGSRSLWDALVAIELLSGERIRRIDLQPFEAQRDQQFWVLPKIRGYSESDEIEWVVLRSSGPVSRSETDVLIDGDWRAADVFQQASGRITQLQIWRSPGADTSHVIVPFRSAA